MNTFTFNDVLINPNYSEVKSRKEVDLTSDFGLFKLSLPIFSANMKTITGPNMANVMNTHGGMGILHRFNTDEEAVSDYIKAISQKSPDFSGVISTPQNVNVGVSIGVQDYDKKRFVDLYTNGARVFCIDVAHGHHILVKNMIKWINDWFKTNKDITIIAGNIATSEAIYDLADWGADIGKVGIGPGSACQTRKNTGVGVPQLFALQNCYEEIKRQGLKIKLIADGGIKCVGDIAKALKYADGVMLGSFISGTTECNGDVFKNAQGQYYKVYMGSASGQNKIINGQESDFIEGTTSEIPFRGKVKYILKEIREGLQSAFSYVGAKNLHEYKNKCQFIRISHSSQEESKI